MRTATELAKRWIDLKELEQSAIAGRRDVEDELLSLLGIPETHVGTKPIKFGDSIGGKIVGRLNQKVDSGKLQEIAAENGISDRLSQLFRWSAEVNKKEWDACGDPVRKLLSAAITTKPGRPSFSLSYKDQEN
jgi:hypothetical protein